MARDAGTKLPQGVIAICIRLPQISVPLVWQEGHSVATTLHREVVFARCILGDLQDKMQ